MNVSVAVHWRKPRGGRIRTVTWIVWMIRPETNGNVEEILKYSQYGDLEKITVHLKVGQNLKISFSVTVEKARMHSSRMRTPCLLTVS